MSNTFTCDSINDVFGQIEEFARLQREANEQTLAKIIQTYDFIAGSMECKHKLVEILPKEAKVVYSPYIENPMLIYAVKKFDIMDVIKAEMTNEEAIELLKHTIVIDINDERKARKEEAIRMGADALKAQKVGKWKIYGISMFDGEGCRCSECGFEGAPYWDFCPKCGARMEGQL